MLSSQLRKLIVFDLLAWTHCCCCRRGGLATLHVPSSSSSCWCGPAVAVIVVIVSRWHWPSATRHCRLRRVGVDLLLPLVVAWPCCTSCCRFHCAGIDALSSSSCCGGICYARLVVVVVVVLSWTRCRCYRSSRRVAVAHTMHVFIVIVFIVIAWTRCHCCTTGMDGGLSRWLWCWSCHRHESPR